MSADERLDAALVRRAIVRSRAQAKEMLQAGRVSVDGVVVTKGSTKVGAEAALAVEGALDPYVGRAAHKLVAALESFSEFAGRVPEAKAIDVGASTGGFTQVLLERGARSVVALDVGHGQLAEPVLGDPRVTNLEGFNIRDLVAADQVDGQPFDIVVSDLSFISLTLALPHMALLLRESGDMVVLVKPQFEVGRERLGRTGIVSSVEQRRESVEKVLAAADRLGLRAHGLSWSPMVGSHGNHEYLLWLRRDQTGAMSDGDIARTIDELTRRNDS